MFPARGAGRQRLPITYLINDTLAIDAGAIGLSRPGLPRSLNRVYRSRKLTASTSFELGVGGWGLAIAENAPPCTNPQPAMPNLYVQARGDKHFTFELDKAEVPIGRELRNGLVLEILV